MRAANKVYRHTLELQDTVERQEGVIKRVPTWIAGFTLIAAIFVPTLPLNAAEGGSRCVEEALDRAIASWTCLGNQLSYTERSGDELIVVEEIVGEPEPTNQSPSLRVFEPADDYDSWCETKPVCHREISSYIHETKGNAAYGDAGGVIGSFDVILRNNLNGRQGRWSVKLIHDSGPSLSFDLLYVNCFKDITILPDTNCGNHPADNEGGYVYVGTGAWYGPLVYGNRLVDSDGYYATVDSYFTPSGYDAYYMAPLRSENFNCYGTDNCYFP